MRQSVLLTGVLTVLLVSLHPVLTVEADSLVSSANPSDDGQVVAFTATFVVSCADGATGTFTVDGVPFSAPVNMNGTQGVATFSTSSLSVGDHTIVFTWSAGVKPDPTCGGTSSLTQTVNAPPTAPPSPPEASSPSTSPEPTVPETTPTDTPAAPTSPTPSTASAPRLNLTANNVALGRFVTGALFAAGLAAVLYVRRRVSG
jgi:hypothetical protein